MMDFVSPEETGPGTVVSMLEEAYGALRETDTKCFAAWRKDWQAFDEFVYGDVLLARTWMFLSRVDGELAGFVSWDPRQRPLALLGHNCVRPQFWGRGYGVMQLVHALEVLRGQGFERVLVQTGVEDFFASARGMYARVGFGFRRELDLVEPCPCRVVEYELILRRTNR
jgi:GNAT superfamily N-acetyltransferase